jgi:probable HAF family extracellular repeat protein
MCTLRKTLTILSVALAAGLLCAASKPPKPAPAPAYTLTMLQVPAGMGSSLAYGLNDLGQVVGYGQTASSQHALVWESASAVATDLDNGYGSSYAYAINNAGQIVGQSRCEENGRFQPVIWTPDAEGGDGYVLTDLGNCPAQLMVNPGYIGYARNINNFGVVVGYYAFSVQGGYVRSAFAIVPEDTNDDGTPDNWFRDDAGDGVNDLLYVLGSDEMPNNIQPWAINDDGWVVGTETIAGISKAVLIIPDFTLDNPWFCDDGFGGNALLVYLPANWANVVTNQGIVGARDRIFAVDGDGTVTQTTVLPPPAGLAINSIGGINNAGQVACSGVGNTGNRNKPNGSAMLWQKDKGTVLLETQVSNMVGFTSLAKAAGINNHGQIVGDGATSTGPYPILRSFLATPTGN